MAFLSRVTRVQDKKKAEENAQLQREAATAAAASKKANSPLEIAKQTILGIPKAAAIEARDIAKGAAEFAVSAGEAPVRLASPKRSAVVLPPAKIPGLGFLGPVQSYQSKAAQAVQDGESVPMAIAKGTLDTFVNDPAGIAFKPLLIGGGFLARQAAKNRGINLQVISDIIRGGKKAVTEAPAVVPDQFAGMTLPERLAATGERKVPVFGDTTLRPIPVKGDSRAVDIPNSARYTPDAELPVIEAGATPRGPALPVAARSPGTEKAPPGYTYEAMLNPRETAPVTRPAPAAPGVAPAVDMAPNAPPGPVLEPVAPPVARETARPAPGGEFKTSGLASGVEAQAVEKKLTDSFEGLSQYQTINIKEQADAATTLITRDYDRAKRVALGLEEAPGDLKNFAVYTAVEQKALKDGDVATLRDLATNSRLNQESSEAAQTLRLLAERDPESPVAAIADVAKTREKVAAKRGVKPGEVKAEIAKAKAAIMKAPKEDWNSFVDSITC